MEKRFGPGALVSSFHSLPGRDGAGGVSGRDGAAPPDSRNPDIRLQPDIRLGNLPASQKIVPFTIVNSQLTAWSVRDSIVRFTVG